MATTRKSRPATGRRVPLVFGSKKTKKSGKEVTVQLIGKVPESTIKALDIKLKPATAAAKDAKLIKAKNGALYLPRSGGTASGRRSMLCSADGISWYSVVVPNGCSYSLAKTVLAKNSKAVAFKTVAGGTQIVGDASKVKAKPKSSAKKPAAGK
ncbi:hypothetical protein [Pseudanabaena yagii]|uniref:Uncharacterized protein n=1 Tax=Pseudanabaena yagii GIHE-NHR1 TaxID=2722753 RepID=A0ABX1LVG6_9CYAN|nr:hypothetical protein [Pseudanabaena yagii]NMF60170.1 hypothetical protein [Pseudanabaena yagii GIHE-NHR1]